MTRDGWFVATAQRTAIRLVASTPKTDRLLVEVTMIALRRGLIDDGEGTGLLRPLDRGQVPAECSPQVPGSPSTLEKER